MHSWLSSRSQSKSSFKWLQSCENRKEQVERYKLPEKGDLPSKTLNILMLESEELGTGLGFQQRDWEGLGGDKERHTLGSNVYILDFTTQIAPCYSMLYRWMTRGE